MSIDSFGFPLSVRKSLRFLLLMAIAWLWMPMSMIRQSHGQSGSLYRTQRPVSPAQFANFQQPVAGNPQMGSPMMPPQYGNPEFGQGPGPGQWSPEAAYQAQAQAMAGFGGPLAGMPSPMMAPSENQNPLAASWTFVPPSAARNLRIHDIVSIRVSEIAQSNSLGNAQSRKSLSLDARLSDWVRLVGIDTIKPAKQSDGDQRVGGIENEVYRSNSNLQTREEITFNIAAEIADIRPNGNLVISAHKTIKLNDNDWEVSLSGICRPQDVGPDNVVLSKDITDLNVNKVERGQVRDGYSRGWFTRWYAYLKPF
jgi:flagellar L-ring protein precursor FlgH